MSLLFSLVFQLPSFAQTPTPTPAATLPTLNKVVWVWLENTSYSDMILQKYVKNLWLNVGAGRFSNFKPVSQVTQANTIAMIAGTDYQIADNDLTRLFTPSLIDLLEAKKISWKIYAEDFPGSCYLNAGAGDYKRYRVPFLSYANVQSDRYLCAKVQSYSNLQSDQQLGALPQFSVIIPNIKNSGAGSDAYTADQTLREVLDPIVTAPETFAQTTIIITTTSLKDATKTGFAMILGNGVNTNGTISDVPVNHFHILRTLEAGLKLGSLHQNDAKVQPITDIWKQ